MAQRLARLEAENAALKKVKREVKQEVKQEKITVKGKEKTVLTIED